MKKQILVLAIVLLSSIVFAQKTEDTKTTENTQSHHAVGIAGGPTIGCGLAYRYTYSKFAAQLTFLPYKTAYGDNDSYEMYCTGFSFYYTLSQGGRSSLFLYQGNHYYYSREEYFYIDNNTNKSDVTCDCYFNNGIGIGIDFRIFDNVSLDIMAGYASYENFTQLGLTGEISLLYHIPSKNK